MKRLSQFAFVIFLLLPTHAFSQKLIEYVSMNSPIAVAVNPVTNMVYAANYNNGTVSVMDGSTNQVVATITVGPMPFSLAVNSITNIIYVSNTGSPQGTGMSIMAIDGNSNTVVATLPLTAYPGLIVVNPVTNLVYFTIEEGPPISVAVMDGTTNQIIAKIRVTETCCQEGLALNSVTNRLYLSVQPLGDKISYIAVIDTDTNTLSGKFTPPGLKFSGKIAVDTGLNRLYQSDASVNQMFVIDGTSNKTIATLPYSAESIAINQTTHVFAIVYYDLTFINGLTDEVLGGQLPFPVGTWRYNLGAGIDNYFYVGYDNYVDLNATGALGVYSGPPSE
jgi:YVTN family beta-propeller protein